MRPQANTAPEGTIGSRSGGMVTVASGWGCTNSSEDSLVRAGRGSELRSTDDPYATPGMPNSAMPSVLADSEVSTIVEISPV